MILAHGQYSVWLAEQGRPKKALWTVGEVAEVIGVPTRTLYAEIDAGRLHAVKLKPRVRPWYLTAAEVDRWIEEET